MSPFLSAMYGGPLDYPGLQDPVTPLGPGLEFDDWWFRGPAVRNAPPKEKGAVAVLPAGANFTLEIACAPEYTTYDGSDPNGNVACDQPGPYHADPDANIVDPKLLSGCAIGIADVMDPNDATMDDFTIISVQANCIWTRNTTFQIPAKMPACTGDWCICGWVWSPQTGISNAYHTPFRCKIDGSPADARPIAPPQDPVYCPDSPKDCTKGAKKLISTYNYPVNVPFTSNYDRPGYHDTFGFFDGPQDDIFLPALVPHSSSSAPTTTSSTTFSRLASSTRTSVSSSKAAPVSSSSKASSSAKASTSSKLIWTIVETTTPSPTVFSKSSKKSSSPTSRRPSFQNRPKSTPSPSPTRSPRLPFASRLSLLPVTTISASPTRAVRRTFKERQAEIELSISKKAVSHSSVKRKRGFGSSAADDGLGMADRLVERMKRVVLHEKRELKVPQEKMVWTRVEL
ncbi:hypothetical protein JCM3765_001687 [Sporobolomyces pararoseus]